MVIRLVRAIPAIIVLGIIALIVFFVVKSRYSAKKGKEVLITVFTWLFIGLSIVFALACLYALVDASEVGFDISLAFLVLCLIGLGITFLSKRTFLKHNPGYKFEAVKAEFSPKWPWSK